MEHVWKGSAARRIIAAAGASHLLNGARHAANATRRAVAAASTIHHHAARLAHKSNANCHAAAAAGALVHHSSSWRDAAMQCHPRPARIARLTRPASLHRRMRVDHDHDGKGRRWWRAMPRLTRALSSVPRLAHTLTCVPICPITQARRGGKALSLAWRA